eukprot:GHVQ01034728.1.p1 GENE.GHVQ01034728.1~~GHVQ01034728.1.p1  ORF type:complete len:192 (+),score=44.08 GHVQ01034728.1:150-725(+)
MEYRQPMHKAVDLHISYLTSSFSIILQNSLVSLTDGAIEDCSIQIFIQQMQLLTLLHSVRSLLQLTSDLSINRILHNFTARYRLVQSASPSPTTLTELRTQIKSIDPLEISQTPTHTPSSSLSQTSTDSKPAEPCSSATAVIEKKRGGEDMWGGDRKRRRLVVGVDPPPSIPPPPKELQARLLYLLKQVKQ